ncbi:MAG: hypothetical protein EXR71_11390 [Myxococcales bacterium]|nr:hypothetical protein [Myxococcales bacterium]
MNAKEQQLLQKKKAPAVGQPAATGKAPVPQAGVKLQQGATVDMQDNVGNSGLRDLMKDPARMSPEELKAQARKDALAVGKARGKKPDAAQGSGEPDQKAKAALDSTAARKKKETESARAKLQAEDAKAARQKALKERAPKGADKTAAKKGAVAEQAKEVPGKGKAGVEETAAAQMRKEAAKKKLGAVEAEAETAKVRATGDRAGEAAQLIRRAGERRVAANDADDKVAGVEARARHEVPKDKVLSGRDVKAHDAGGKTVPEAGKKGVGPGAEAKAAAAETERGKPDERALTGRALQTAQLAGAQEVAEEKVVVAKGKKAEVEGKLDVEVDGVKAAALGREAETQTASEKAAEDHARKKDEEVDAVAAAKESDRTIVEVTRAADLPEHDGDEVTLVGVYVPRPADAGGPQLGHVSILVGTQEIRLGKDTRSTAEILKLSGERVVVTGKLDLRKQAGQALDPARREKPLVTGFRSPYRR